ncbi:hypothetical protein [Massilia phosphatilytica]
MRGQAQRSRNRAGIARLDAERFEDAFAREIGEGFPETRSTISPSSM